MAIAIAEERSEEIIKRLEEREKRGFVRGELKPFIEGLAQEFEVSFPTVKNKYYNFVKGKHGGNTDKRKKKVDVKVKDSKDSQEITSSIEKEVKDTSKENASKGNATVNLDNSIEEHHKSVPKDNYIKPNKPPYKYGQLVTCEVINIVSYGVFLEINDGYGYQGLLHVSEIKNGFVDSINDYFDIGDEVKVKIKMAASEDRIQFSTKDLKVAKKAVKREWELPQNPPINNLGEKLGAKLKDMKENLVTKPKQVTEEEYVDAYKQHQEEERKAQAQKTSSTSSTTPAKKEELNSLPTLVEIKENKEVEDVSKYLNNIVGALSPRAKEDLYNLLNENGVFKSTIAIAEAQKEFDVDLGVLFLQRVKEKIGGCL